MAKRRQIQTILLLLVSTVFLLASCSDPTNDHNVENTVAISYTPPVVPLTFSIDTNGHISYSIGVKVIFPLGEIGVSATSSITVHTVPKESLLLVIRHKVTRGQNVDLVDSSYQINIGHTVGSADVKGNIDEVKLAWNGQNNSLFIDASKGDITSIVIQGATQESTTVVSTSTPLPATHPKPTVTPRSTPSPIAAHERLTIDFKKNTTCGNISTAITSINAYKGDMRLTISGGGKAKGNQESDAFYIYTDEHQKPISPTHNDTIGAILFINNQPADTFIKGTLPPFTSSHVYTLIIKAPGGRLTFSVGDCKASNNSGSYIIAISS